MSSCGTTYGISVSCPFGLQPASTPVEAPVAPSTFRNCRLSIPLLIDQYPFRFSQWKNGVAAGARGDVDKGTHNEKTEYRNEPPFALRNGAPPPSAGATPNRALA